MLAYNLRLTTYNFLLLVISSWSLIKEEARHSADLSVCLNDIKFLKKRQPLVSYPQILLYPALEKS